MMSYRIPGCLIAIAVFLSSGDLNGQKISNEQLKFFESKIRPVLVRECYSCHSEQAGQNKGGLQLDTKIRMSIGGDNGPAITPGDLDESLLWNAINHIDFVMPPRKKLTDREIEDFRAWIEMGAPDPRVSKTQKVQSTVTEADIRKGRKFWSFSKPKQRELPEPTSSWARDEIDVFIAAKHRQENLSPSEDADPYSFLRRLSVDLIGLPPNPEQIDWFVSKWQRDPDSAIASAIDKLLASERFGERWGRHWLDVARYAESTGRELNATFPHAWRYRDYVIDAFNDDKPYDEFVQEQIAGDLIRARSDEEWAEHLVATGFLAVGPKTLTEQNSRQFKLDLVDEQIDVTSRVILGVSLACARCHDHKFDPIRQEDYYAVAGMFESTNTHYGTLDSPQNLRPSSHLVLPISDPNPFDASLDLAEIEKLESELTDLRERLRDLQQQRREQRQQPDANLQRSLLNITRTVTRIAAIEAKLDSVNDDGSPVSFCMGVQDSDRPTNSRLLVRGEFDQPAEEIERGFIQVLQRSKPRIKANQSGRLQLAKWLTSERNPLTARVMVNRIWLHMFGEGLVRTPENFGATGLRPTHPELLDNLAIDFMENDWSVKHLIRRIAQSRTYRMSSKFEASNFELDPENLFLWRANSRQLDAETLRDSMMYVSGELEFERPRASTVAEAGLTIVRDGRLIAFQLGDNSSMMNESRRGRRLRNLKVFDINAATVNRSVYLPIVRDSLPRALEVFDFAEPGMVIGKRDTSNTPTQGLYLLNNEFVVQQSQLMAERLIDQFDDADQQIEHAFLLAFGRPASAEQIDAATEFYDSFEVKLSFRQRRSQNNGLVERKKLAALTQALMASAEFRYLN